jgi:hypothetical protein
MRSGFTVRWQAGRRVNPTAPRRRAAGIGRRGARSVPESGDVAGVGFGQHLAVRPVDYLSNNGAADPFAGEAADYEGFSVDV